MANPPINQGSFINQAFSGYADAYYEREMKDLRMPAAIQEFARQLKIQSGIIEDWGCGPGHWTAELQKYGLPHQYKLIEVSEGMLEKAQSVVKESDFELMDVRHRNVDQGSLLGIIMGYLIPYLNEDEMLDLMSKAVRALQPGGCLVLAFMASNTYRSFQQSSSDGKFTLQMNYHNSFTIIELLESNKLTCTYYCESVREDHLDIIEVWKKED